MKTDRIQRKGFTLVEMMVVMVLSVVVFSALASAMTQAFRFWNDANARWKLANVARLTRVRYLDGHRSAYGQKGTGMLSCDLIDASANARAAGMVMYHYPSQASTVMVIMVNYAPGSGGKIPFNDTAYSQPAYKESSVQTGYNESAWTAIGDTIWLFDNSVKVKVAGGAYSNATAVTAPTNLYTRRFNITKVAQATGAEVANYLETDYELIFLSGGMEYVHPEHISTRLINNH